MPIPLPFDFKNPDYISVLEWRLERYRRLLRRPNKIIEMREFYQEDPVQFIIDWGMTFDPRKVDRGQPTMVPFLLYPRQEEWARWFLDCWRRQVPGVTAKSREVGLSWVSTALAASLCLFNDGMVIGFGSRKELYVDKLGDPKAILEKVRIFMRHIPPEFRNGWIEGKHSTYMRIHFPGTNALITGESGDNIGRGDRTSIYVLDESAHIPRPDLIEASLSETTNCRQDISTPWGMDNPFARKFHDPAREKFRFHWSDDARKDQAWYDKKCKDIGDPTIIAQELDLDFSASKDGIVIPAAHVRAAIDAHIKLGIKPSGIRRVGLDLADQGADMNAFAGRFGVVVEYLEQWTGVGIDIHATIQKTFGLCDILGYDSVSYDSVGVGADVRGAARVINDTRTRAVRFDAFNGAEGVLDPDKDPFGVGGEVGRGRTNLDFFANFKAQCWWLLRRRFHLTYRMINGDKDGISPDDIISLPSGLPEVQKLVIELSQPTYSINNAGKVVIDKKPDGAYSPNMADSVVMAFAPERRNPPGILECI